MAPPDGQSLSSDFVSKLYQMLNTTEYQGIVRWGNRGDSFVILDTMLFQQLVIPQVFNHANFSSFVRQLNKYDFHKIKFSDPQSRVWEFQHPEFNKENQDRPYLIKRKPPARRAPAASALTGDTQKALGDNAARIAKEVSGQVENEVADLQSRVDHLESTQRKLLRAMRMQQNLIEKLCAAVNLPDDTPTATPGRQPTFLAKSETDVTSPQPQPQPASSYSAILAYDDPGAGSVLARFLEQYGCTVEIANNGVELVQQVESSPPDLVVCDVVLSHLDGLSATELIRQTNPDVPIIVITESHPPPNTDLYILRGASAVFVRPFSRSELWRTLADLLEPKVPVDTLTVNPAAQSGNPAAQSGNPPSLTQNTAPDDLSPYIGDSQLDGILYNF